jgi:hypothetical protein
MISSWSEIKKVNAIVERGTSSSPELRSIIAKRYLAASNLEPVSTEPH